MEKQFKNFNKNIRLTDKQEEDAKTKYDGVCKSLHNYYYPNKKYNGSTKFLFGSYKKRTNIRPITKEQDVDVLFYMPNKEFKKYNDYESNGQSALLQKIKDILKDTYSTTDKIKGWGKVVLVEFSENKHNVEILPAWELEDKTFVIPNSEDGGSWDIFDPREDIDIFQKSNVATSELTAKLSRMIKSWKRNTPSLTLKSFQIEQYVIDFLSENYDKDIEISNLSQMFFEYLMDEINEYNKSYVKTALNRANRAIEYENDTKYDKACDEWKKIFGDLFPKWNRSIKLNKSNENYTEYEQYIEDMFDQDLSLGYTLEISCDVIQDGFRKMPLITLLRDFILKPSKKLEFYIKKHNIPTPYKVYWKVKNFGEEAKNKNDLRGEITKDKGQEKKNENTKYRGQHYVECYIIKDNICVARDKIDIPISEE